MKEESKRIEDLKNQVYSREEYAKANFWDERYSQNSGFFDWYAEYPELKHSFVEYNLNPSDRILMVGCGNSKLSFQMWQAGFKNMVNIDISPSVIQQMKKEFPDLEWEVMDATKMTYKDSEFDAIIDKGTLDALISGKNYDICEEMLRQCMRVTKQNGQILLITYGSPEGRRKIFQNPLPFNSYDYYQCRAELNDMSTMINLMRSNVEGGLKDILNDKEALAKTMKQFSIVKMLRRRRINKKQYILWNSMQKKQIQLNPTYLKTEQIPPKDKQTEKQQKVQEKNEKKEEISTESKFSYEPKKQSYVYVYSIRRKFAFALDELLKDSTEESLIQQFNPNNQSHCLIEGTPDLSPLTIYTNKSNFTSAFNAIEYLRKKSIPHPSCRFSVSYDNPLENSLRLSVVSSEEAKQSMLSLRKTNLKFKITIDQRRTSAEEVIDSLKKLSSQLVSLCDLYPCPKTYAMFFVLKKRGDIPSVNILMEKYWFPTYQIISYSAESLVVKISLPPVQKEKEEEIVKNIIKSIKFVKFELLETLPGFLSFFDLQLYNIVSMAALSYSNDKLELILQDFWQKDELSNLITPSQLLPSNQYIQIYSTLVLHKFTLSKMLTHILAFY